ncbi:NADH dehydrogenase [Neisseria lactamica]|uniref:NADH dehydrogenase n=1 Tax=Neisseria lactamica TaxID=486 RepID=A0A378WB69_NEILA|nr:NADH dehydrogenase [Neisseria lactamica]
MNQANQNLLHPSRQVGADLTAWRKVGGGEGLLAALADPQSIVSKLQEANLCGMGGAGFPTWRKWEAAVAAQSKHGRQIRRLQCQRRRTGYVQRPRVAGENAAPSHRRRIDCRRRLPRQQSGFVRQPSSDRLHRLHHTRHRAMEKQRFVYPYRKLLGQTFGLATGRNFRPLYRWRRNRRDFLAGRRFPVPRAASRRSQPKAVSTASRP